MIVLHRISLPRPWKAQWPGQIRHALWCLKKKSFTFKMFSSLLLLFRLFDQSQELGKCVICYKKAMTTKQKPSSSDLKTADRVLSQCNLGMLRPTRKQSHLRTHQNTHSPPKMISYRVPYEGYPKVLRGGLHSISWLVNVTHSKQQKTSGALLKT